MPHYLIRAHRQPTPCMTEVLFHRRRRFGSWCLCRLNVINWSAGCSFNSARCCSPAGLTAVSTLDFWRGSLIIVLSGQAAATARDVPAPASSKAFRCSSILLLVRRKCPTAAFYRTADDRHSKAGSLPTIHPNAHPEDISPQVRTGKTKHDRLQQIKGIRGYRTTRPPAAVNGLPQPVFTLHRFAQ